LTGSSWGDEKEREFEWLEWRPGQESNLRPAA
jgi:hypothetical protein